MRTKKRSTMKTYSRRKLLDALPQDLIIEVVVHVAAASPAPLDDLKRLRSACKRFYEASKVGEVGRSMSVEKEWARHWWHKDDYFVFLGHCATSGNLEASFILGLEEVYNLRISSGLQHLHRAAAGGHLAASYSMGVILFYSPATQNLGMELLNELAAGDKHTSSGEVLLGRCRTAATRVLRRISMRRWRVAPPEPCRHDLCGAIMEREWLDGKELKRGFCSQLCRWKQECYKFFEQI